MTSSDPSILPFMLAFLIPGATLSPRNLTWFISLDCWADAYLLQPQDPHSHPLGIGRWQGGNGEGVEKNQDI